MTSIIVCSFATGIDDMPRKDQRDPIKVLRVLDQGKRYSVFEATDNQTIAKTMDYLIHKSGYVKTIGGEFPWTQIEITDAGRAALANEDGV
jgi:hypothetical protein